MKTNANARLERYRRTEHRLWWAGAVACYAAPLLMLMGWAALAHSQTPEPPKAVIAGGRAAMPVERLGLKSGSSPSVDNAALFNATQQSDTEDQAKTDPFYFGGVQWRITKPMVSGYTSRRFTGMGNARPASGNSWGATRGPTSRIIWNANPITFNGTTITATGTSGSAVITVAGYTPLVSDGLLTLRITGGTNFTTGVYHVLSVSGQTLKLDRSCCTGAGSAMTGYLKGTVWRDQGYGNIFEGLTYQGSPTYTSVNAPDKNLRAAVGWQSRPYVANVDFNGTTITGTATTNVITCTGSSAYVPSSLDIGRVLTITGGSGLTTGNYTVTAVSGQTMTMSANVTASSGSALAGTLFTVTPNTGKNMHRDCNFENVDVGLLFGKGLAAFDIRGLQPFDGTKVSATAPSGSSVITMVADTADAYAAYVPSANDIGRTLEIIGGVDGAADFTPARYTVTAITSTTMTLSGAVATGTGTATGMKAVLYTPSPSTYDGHADQNADHHASDHLLFGSNTTCFADVCNQSINHAEVNWHCLACNTLIHFMRGGRATFDGMHTTTNDRVVGGGPCILRIGGAGTSGGISSTVSSPIVIRNVVIDDGDPSYMLLWMDGTGNPNVNITFEDVHNADPNDNPPGLPIVNVKDGAHVTLINVERIHPGGIRIDNESNNGTSNFIGSVTLINCGIVIDDDDAASPNVVNFENDEWDDNSFYTFIGCHTTDFSAKPVRSGVYKVGTGWQSGLGFVP